MAEYKRPGMATGLANALIKAMNWFGVSPQGSQTLVVRGRKSGKWMSAPVNPMDFEGSRYLVAPRGDTHWARNLRAAGTGELRLGKKRVVFKAREVPEVERPKLIAAYLERWGTVTREHFGTSSMSPGEDELARLAARTPVFRIE
jgi:deazaflavin-dependent oxidoreductase (nitroreductase family)